MAKFCYIQDFQITGKNSVHYIGDYFYDCMTMLDEILSIAKREKCETILDGGDFLDVACPSYRVLDEIADRVEKAKIPIYSLFGNHAERYHSLEHSQYTGLAHLIKRSKYFRYLTKIEGEDFTIEGIEYSHNVEDRIKLNGINFLEEIGKGARRNKWKVAICHAFICPKKFPFGSHVVCDDIKTNADLVIVAHYHAQWEKIVDNTRFLDIGCLGRTSITERDVTPKIAILDTNKRSVTTIELTSAKPGEEIFDLSKVQELKLKDQGIEKFIRSIESASFQATNIKDNIKIIGKEKKVDKEVIDLIIKKIGEME